MTIIVTMLAYMLNMSIAPIPCFPTEIALVTVVITAVVLNVRA